MTPAGKMLGRFAVPVTVVVVLTVIGMALLQHFLLDLNVIAQTDAFIDSIAMVAVGIVLGGAGVLTQLNGTVAKVNEHEASIKTLADATPGVAAVDGTVVRTP